ncbi:hypothetical protein TWF694_003994 [Orbilia ellipsospora]|uniref:F-box domain-containing protein n=1 Tax=Orbilia ellipsospora TaxID=2528407 RepID=A0AAV9WXT2_9PEZI
MAAMSTRPTRRAAAKASSSKSATAVVTYTTPRQAKYPPWNRLPYLILLEIFKYASTDARSVDHTWLYKTSFTCKAFFEPAINLLYGFPPTTPTTRLRKFAEAITANPILGEKVHTLESTNAEILDSKLVKFEIDALVRMTPNIREICISTESQKAETSFFLLFTPLRPPKKLDIPPNLLMALEDMKVQLRNWTWDFKLCAAIINQYDTLSEVEGGGSKKKKKEKGLGWFDVIHREFEAFKTLRSLTLSNFDNVGNSDVEEGKAKVDIATIAGALGHLKYLKSLTLRKCGFFGDYFITQIAGVHRLNRVVLDGLENINVTDLQEFLRVCGKDLEELEVIHCPGVVLGFLCELDTSTPKLRKLLFEDVPGLLSADELSILDIPMPQWPTTLETLVMRSLANWRAVDCERFLKSLVDTARSGGFKSLREVDIWCILPELGWRERAKSRIYWGDEFAMAFLDRRGNAWQEFLQKKKSEGQKISVDSDATTGLCQRVLFRLDDSRPTENQLNEDDFLDLAGAGTGKPSKRRAPPARSPQTKGKGKTTATAKRTAKVKKPSPTKRKSESQSFVVGRKRPRYNSDEDEDFKVDQLAYDDEDGDDSSWSVEDDE